MRLTDYLLPTAIFFVLFLIIQFYWSRRRLIASARKLNGPPALPIIGNALYFWCKTEDVLEKINYLVGKYEHPMRFWLGPELMIVTADPEQVEKIICSSKLVFKHNLYEYLRIFLGEGLVSSSGGPTYKKHRRILQPMFDLKYSISRIKCFEKHLDIIFEKLDKIPENTSFDIEHYIHTCTVDFIGETIFGNNFQSQTQGEHDYSKKMQKAYAVVFNRLVKVWLQSDLIFNVTEHKTTQDECLKATKAFAEQAIIESWIRRKLIQENDVEGQPIVDKITEYVEKNPGSFSSEDIIDHLNTLFTASQDTITTNSSFGLMCFGMYPECQQKAYEELQQVLGNSPQITIEDINKLEYLDQCVKEIFRCFPIAPYIIRTPLEDFKVSDKWTIPKGAAVVIPIFNLHYNPKQWANPTEFDPDHFLPDVVSKRHTYSYIPFSAGTRGCIGKIFGTIGVKLVLCKLLQRYEVRAEGKLPDLELKMDISTRPKHGYNIQLKKRPVLD